MALRSERGVSGDHGGTVCAGGDGDEGCALARDAEGVVSDELDLCADITATLDRMNAAANATSTISTDSCAVSAWTPMPRR